jgi:hypothetical protein
MSTRARRRTPRRNARRTSRWRRAPRYIADFDSTSSLLYALAECLRGRDLPAGGLLPCAPQLLATVLDMLPVSLLKALYSWSGWWEAIPARELACVEAEEIATWVVRQYPERPYPGGLIGSANGAAIYVAAALGMPWLPQTFLIPVRRALDPDDVQGDVAWGRAAIPLAWAASQDLLLHQMHDPVQDRLMLRRMAYLRVKRRTLGEQYKRWMAHLLPPGVPLIIVECRLQWPVTTVREQYVFQMGGLGDTTPAEYGQGSARVAQFLREQGADRQRWEVPRATHEAPEAEWGYAPALTEEVRPFAQERGYRLRRLVFTHPEDLSPFTADLYQWWYARRGLRAPRLMIECFALVQPWWVLGTGSVPFWIAFNTEVSATAVDWYLDCTPAFEDIALVLLSNGVTSIGLASPDRWRAVLARAERQGRFLGLNTRKYPADIASFLQSYIDLKRYIPLREERPAPLNFAEFEEFVDETAGRYAVHYRAE